MIRDMYVNYLKLERRQITAKGRRDGGETEKKRVKYGEKSSRSKL
jgi:hypothetical protein